MLVGIKVEFLLYGSCCIMSFCYFVFEKGSTPYLY